MPADLSAVQVQEKGNERKCTSEIISSSDKQACHAIIIICFLILYPCPLVCLFCLLVACHLLLTNVHKQLLAWVAISLPMGSCRFLVPENKVFFLSSPPIKERRLLLPIPLYLSIAFLPPFTLRLFLSFFLLTFFPSSLLLLHAPCPPPSSHSAAHCIGVHHSRTPKRVKP